jgi:predicted peroxiredoxin
MMVLQFVIAINFKSFDYEIYMFEMSKLVKLMSKVNWNKILAYKNVSHSG